MERSSTFSTSEVVGIATAAATALGAVVVALGRAQAAAARARVVQTPAPPLARLTPAQERGREMARVVVDAVTTRYPEMRHEAESFVSRLSAAPRPAASNVAHAAAERAHQARESSAHVLDRLQHNVRPAAGEALSALKERARESRPAVGSAVSSVASQASASTEVAVAKSSSAARDMVGTIMWLAAACTVIYVAFLDQDKREQVKTFLSTAFEQIRLLIQDFQGYDDEL